MESILESVKSALGIDKSQTEFDTELIMYVNTALATLTQIGVGPVNGFAISSSVDKWSDFLPDDPKWSQVKTYIYTKVRLIFDPPQSAAAVEAMNKIASELEWRLYVVADNDKTQKEE